MVILSFFIKFGICINLTIRNFPIFWLWEEEKGRGKFMTILTIFIGSKFLEVNSLKMFTKVSALADIHAPFFGPVFS